MKKIFALMLVCALSKTTHSQHFRLTAKGAFNSTWLFNKTQSDAGDELDYKASFAPQFGLAAMFMIDDHVGVSLDGLIGQVRQKFTNREGDSITFESEEILNTVDLPILFRYTGESGAYFEIGPQFSLIQNGKYEEEGLSSVKIDEKSIASMFIAAALGFGYDISLSDQLWINTGLRFVYGFTDVLENPNDLPGYEPTNAAVGGFHLGLTYQFGD